LIVAADTFLYVLRQRVVSRAAQYGIPTMYQRREFAEAGGRISYGPDYHDLGRQCGAYAGRILRGEKPADLPVVQPIKFELVINLKAARALGLDIPPMLLALADNVIE
jgi:putative tryptophan/tyrosine transport system substrate-binding protein